MPLQYFRFDFKGKEGKHDNSFIKLRHEDVKDYGQVTVGLSEQGDPDARNEALEDISSLSRSLSKKVHRYSWDFHEAIMVETEGFDTGLGMIFSSKLEEKGVVPKGSTKKFKEKLEGDGYELKEKDLRVFTHLMGENEPPTELILKQQEKKVKEKKRLFHFFRKAKAGRSK